jgi:hypothetical protein
MTINVYWSCIEKEWMRASPPEPISPLFYKSHLFDKNDIGLDMNKCPSFNDNINNVFALRSIYSYELTVDSNGVLSNSYGQAFFDEHVTVKSLNKRLISFRQSYTFLTDEKSLKVTLSEPPFLEDNQLTRDLLIIPGVIDIGKWYRNTDTMFYMKDGVSSFKINEGDIYGYVRFHTDEDINFIQYRHTDTLNKYMMDSVYSKENKKRTYPLTKYYSMFKSKNLVLEEIKKNILGEQ